MAAARLWYNVNSQGRKSSLHITGSASGNDVYALCGVERSDQYGVIAPVDATSGACARCLRQADEIRSTVEWIKTAPFPAA